MSMASNSSTPRMNFTHIKMGSGVLNKWVTNRTRLWYAQLVLAAPYSLSWPLLIIVGSLDDLNHWFKSKCTTWGKLGGSLSHTHGKIPSFPPWNARSSSSNQSLYNHNYCCQIEKMCESVCPNYELWTVSTC